jgi:hypothetical protein
MDRFNEKMDVSNYQMVEWMVNSVGINSEIPVRTERMVDFDFLIRKIVGVCKMVTEKVRYEKMQIK